MKNSVMITGGGGYIGSHAVKLFLKKGHKVVVVDNFSRGYKDALKNLEKYGNVECHEVDLLDKDSLDKVFEMHNDISAVLHFAALCLVDESMREPEIYFRNNVGGSLNLFESMRVHNVRKLVFSSTCAVYGESSYLPMDEDHPKVPTNPYGESKLMVERMLKWYHAIHDFDNVTFRYFNVCGADPESDIGDSKKPSQLLLQNAVRGAMEIEEFNLTCPMVGTPDGTPIRDYIDVNDLVEAHYLAYLKIRDDRLTDEFNIGTGKGVSVEEIISTVERVLGKHIERKRVKPRLGEYAIVYADTSKASSVLKWYPKYTIDDSVKNLYNWYKKYPKGFDS